MFLYLLLYSYILTEGCASKTLNNKIKIDCFMIDIELIRKNAELVIKNLKKRQDEEKVRWVLDVQEKDEKWRKLKGDADMLRAERNTISQQINEAKKAGKDTLKIIEKAKRIPQEIAEKEAEVGALKDKINELMMRIPNLLEEGVPVGKSDADNVEIKKFGKLVKPKFELKSHVEVAEGLGVADFERSAKISGHGFYFLKEELALLNRALIQFAIDFLRKREYVYTEPPLMMLRKPYEGVVDLGDFEKVMYIAGDEHLIATSEHPLTAQFMDEVLDEKALPLRFCGYSMCFRREVGGHGIDTKGLFRTHQFNKVEQIIICKPEESKKMHEEIQKNAEALYKALKIPFRVVSVCTGDIGSIASKKYDTEAWMPRQQMYREVGSASNCTDYQARRLNIRYTDKDGERKLVHTLNNTAIATSRCMVAILENFQQKDGSVKVPSVLWKYMGGVKVIKRK